MPIYYTYMLNHILLSFFLSCSSPPKCNPYTCLRKLVTTCVFELRLTQLRRDIFTMVLCLTLLLYIIACSKLSGEVLDPNGLT